MLSDFFSLKVSILKVFSFIRFTLTAYDVVPMSRIPHRCDFCGRSFSTRKILNDHMDKYLTVIVCEICNVTFDCRPGFIQHCKTQTHVGNVSLKK